MVADIKKQGEEDASQSFSFFSLEYFCRQPRVDYMHKFKISTWEFKGREIYKQSLSSKSYFDITDRISGVVCLIKEMICVPLKCVIYLVITV